MILKGVYLTLWIGKAKPEPAKKELMESLQSVEVTQNDKERSGFELAFQVAHGQKLNDLKPFNRVILMVTINSVKQVLMDGIISYHQLASGNATGPSIFTVFGEDVSIMMDLKTETIPHKGQDDATIARDIISKYSSYGITAEVESPKGVSQPGANDWVPRQNATDLEQLKSMAEKYGFVFYISPGPVEKKNVAYWGPPKYKGTRQKALCTNMGPHSNVETINFSYDSLAPTLVKGNVQDEKTNQIEPVDISSSQLKKISKNSALESQSKVRLKLLLQKSGLNLQMAMALAQGMTDVSLQKVAKAEGTLNTLRYGDLLQPRKLVDLRGAGQEYNGEWYVEKVTHKIRRGEYKQSFTLTKEGTG
jgi:phage protein D